ncbi:hypothetical protein OQJ13_08955 [Legionella sp. PATHC035]|uniref:hypothetical protein n=1 Tax=Legionella sp. PATHC035 TaxID=2992040 RepID=UPI0022441AD9|nr:hypothetical protein [Legionella sp. PATHC035]MCW8409098.1 hypothetical protein [Legionella sp. PATHC035]
MVSKVYFVQGVFSEVYKAWGHASVLEIIPKDDNKQLEMDLYGRVQVFRTPGIKEKLVQRYFQEQHGAHPVRDYYYQSDPDGGAFRFLMGVVPFFDQGDPDNDSNLPVYGDARAAYLDTEKEPAALSIFYRKDKPDQWLITVVKNTHLPKEQRQVYLLSSVDPKSFMIDDSIPVEEGELNAVPAYLQRLRDVADLPAELSGIGEILNNILNADGTIKEHADLLTDLFTGRLSDEKIALWPEVQSGIVEYTLYVKLVGNSLHYMIKTSEGLIKDKIALTDIKSFDHQLALGEQLQTIKNDIREITSKRGHWPVTFDEDPEWMQLLKGPDVVDKEGAVAEESAATTMMNNPYLIALHSMGPTALKISKEEIKDCLNKESQLAKNLQSILDDELLKKNPNFQKEHFELVHNLFQLQRSDLWSVLKADTEGFIRFFNDLADKDARLLKSILQKEQGIDCLHLIHKCKTPHLIFDLLQSGDEREQLIDDLIGLAQFAAVAARNVPKNQYILSLSFQFVLKYPNRVLTDNPAKFLEDIIPRPNEFNETRLQQFCTLRKLIEFLNKTRGIEKIKPELLFPFLSANLDNKDLITSVQEAFAKLDTLNVKNSEAYALVLRSAVFRKIVADLKADEVEKSEQCIELAINLDKMGQLGTYSVLSDDLKVVKAFNQFARHEGLKDILVATITGQGAAACKPILENEILSVLVAADIKVSQEQAAKILNPKLSLPEQLNEILKNKDYDPPKRKILYQLAFDLDVLGAPEAFKELAQKDKKFLDLLHQCSVVPEYRELLKSMLSGYASGLWMLELMAYSDVPFSHFEEHLNKPASTLDDALKWVYRNKTSPEVTSVAIEFLFKKPDLEIGDLRSVIEFLQDTPKCAVARESMVDFLAAHFQAQDLLSRVNRVYKKFAALGEVDNKFYTLALKEERFRAIAEALPPIGAEQDCGFIRTDATPTNDVLGTFTSPQYILTKEGFFYYNPSHKKLLSIDLEKAQWEALNKNFPQTIAKLAERDFKLLTETAPIREHNKNLIELAESLHSQNALDKYYLIASSTRLASTYVRFIKNNFASIGRELFKRIASMDYDLELMPESDEPEKHTTLYIKVVEDLFHYAVKTPEGVVKKGIIATGEVDNFKPEQPLVEQLENIKSKILNITSERGDTRSKVLNLLENKHLIALVDAFVGPSEPQLRHLLDSSSDKFKAMDILLSLKLDVAKTEAYQWAIIDTSTAKNFRKVLFQINEMQGISVQTKAKMIDTLCSLQLGYVPGKPHIRDRRDAFSLYLGDDTKGRRFRSSITQIEETCTKIKARWNAETAPANAKAKAKAFQKEEQSYRKGLYEAVFDNLHQPMSKKDFEGRIEQASQCMLSVVDVRRRSWIIAVMETLAEALNIAFGTGISRFAKSKTFFTRTASGQEVRNLNHSLIKEDPKQDSKGDKEEIEKQILDAADTNLPKVL